VIRIALFFLLLSMHPVLQAQDDVQVVLHEDVVNKVMKAVGDISDTAEYKVMFFTGKYKWTIVNPKIELKANGKAEYTCEALVDAGFIFYRTDVVGDAEVTYDKEKNIINVQIKHAMFEIYTRILGTKMHITNIDLARYYTDPFTFEGPMTLVTSIPFTMPDNSIRTIYAVPQECTLEVQEDKIVVNCEVEFTDKDPAKK
jgi:hypothetical protein